VGCDFVGEMSEYQKFLAAKSRTFTATGLDTVPDLHPSLFPFQRDIVSWALRRGRACVFADCGMGKTFMQVEWARCIPGDVLILAPLAVAGQTVKEAAKLGVTVRYCRSAEEVQPGITIANYEMLEHFDCTRFRGVVLDESGILKNYEGKFRNLILSTFAQTQFRLACTATPAPNDHMELGNHAEFVGAMSRTEMLSMFFVHDGGDTAKWRLKGHAESEFWKWICSWAVMIRKPSDLGYEDGGFILPPMTISQQTVEHHVSGDYLFAMEAMTLQERIAARRESVTERADKCAEVVGDSAEPWLIWCNLNNEQEYLRKLFGDRCVSLTGSMPYEEKLAALDEWLSGRKPIMISKPSIIGHGLNAQHCRNVAFVGLSDSWEQYYQACRRCYRFGQTREVRVHIITSSAEGQVVANINRKESDAARMAAEMVKHMHSMNEQNIRGTSRKTNEYKEQTRIGKNYTMHLGDCVEVVSKLPDASVGFSVFSPPFASLYTYSASDRDMGNSNDYDEFSVHFGFLVDQLFRVMMPGRLVSFHCMNLPTSKSHHGYIGLRDFRGHLIRAFEERGFIFHSEVCIWKDPVTAMQRTKAIGLLHKQLVKDSCMSRQGIPDYLVTMRKPGANAEPVEGELDRWHGDDSFRSTGRLSIDLWQRYASPVWMDINPSRTLQKESAREEKDERHICPLQLDVIERALALWSNPGDLVLSPFTGIGSEGFVALKNGRRFVGAELKESYYRQACANLDAAESAQDSDMFPAV